jgi:hypothetical protein
MLASFVVAAALVSATQNAPLATTPLEVLDICRFNAARADETLLHHRIDLTGTVAEVERDGIGGYIVRLQAMTHEPDFIGRIELQCHFAGSARSDLAKIAPGTAVTIRGVPRTVRDQLGSPIDKHVIVTLKECGLVASGE